MQRRRKRLARGSNASCHLQRMRTITSTSVGSTASSPLLPTYSLRCVLGRNVLQPPLPVLLPETQRIGYVVKRYPRYSETFIVNEILAHEAAGLDLTIFALRPPVDTHFQELLARVRAPVQYILDSGKAREFWHELDAARMELEGFDDALDVTAGEDASTVYQAIRLARSAYNLCLDHLHAHFATSAASVVRLAARFTGVSWSFTAHAKDIFHESVDPDDLARKLEGADAVITVSDYNVAFLQAEPLG